MKHLVGLPHSPPPASTLGAIACATLGAVSLTAKSALSSGFGTVIRKERDLQSTTEECLGFDRGPHSAAVDRILREQFARLGANIAILEQRYEALPAGSRMGVFQSLPQPPLSARGPSAPNASSWLVELVGQHEGVMTSVDRLVADGADGQRGALILAEVAQNHEEMVWMLTALLRDGLGTCDIVPIAIDPTVNGTRSTAVGRSQP